MTLEYSGKNVAESNNHIFNDDDLFAAAAATAGLRRELLRAWHEQIYKEYDNIIYHFRLKLRPPVIQLVELSGRWGQWAPATRTLSLSTKLIQEHAWDIVLEILKHEIAHQLVDEDPQRSRRSVRPHGEAFQAACSRLAVQDWARSASGELPTQIPNWRDKLLGDAEERLLRRAEKLLALATSDNEHEAAIAMQRVRQLYATHNIERLRSQQAGSGSAHIYCLITTKKKRLTAEQTGIIGLLVEHFFVQAVYMDLYDAVDLCTYKAVELLGTRTNILMAEYVYHFLLGQLQRLWRSYQREHGRAASARRSYMLGVLSGFRDKLAKSAPWQPEAASTQPATPVPSPDASGKALLKLAESQLQDFMSQRHPRLRWRRGGGGRRDPDSYQAGVVAGSNLNLHRPVGTRDGNRGLRLGPK